MSVQAPDPKDLANFGWLEGWFARGAEPTPPGFRWLKDNGFVTVVNLRAEDDTEAILTAALGMACRCIPVADNTAPSDAQAAEWIALCADPSMRPLFVHCESGHGRTSTFCILLRLAQGWKLETAIEEQVRFGFKPDHEVAQIEYLHDVHHRLKRGELTFPPIP